MIACPICGSGNTGVVASRPNPEGHWRRRRCKDCGTKFTTSETVKPVAVRGAKKTSDMPVDERIKIG